MANLFGLPTPEEVRQRTAQGLFTRFAGQGAQGGAGTVGAALGMGLASLFGSNPQISRAQKIQGIQQKVQSQFGDEISTPEDFFKLGSALSGELMRAGETDLGLSVMNQIKGLQPQPQKAPDTQKQVNVLRKDISNVTKNFRATNEAVKKIEDSGKRKTAQSDMSMIFQFMKILDPGSTVREGEFANAQQTAGLPGRIVNLYNQAWEGTRLNDTQRKNFLTEARGLVSATREAADIEVENILQQADVDQISRERVLGKKRLQALQKRQRRKPKPKKDRSIDELIKLYGN